MGATNSVSDKLAKARSTMEVKYGKINVTGRYFIAAEGGNRLEDDYAIDKNKILGSGFSGNVYVAKNKHTQVPYAIKSFKLKGIDAEQKDELVNESQIFMGMDHPHVARLAAAYEDSDFLHLIMELMSGGELLKRVVKKKKYGETESKHVCWQMLLAINYLHENDIVHRDLKLENFLYESEEPDAYIKLIDFGFSKIWETNSRMKAALGTPIYVAPDVLECSYTSKCDLWSFGVICYALLMGSFPFTSPNQDELFRKIRAGPGVKQWGDKNWNSVSPEAKDFVQKVLAVDPITRLSAPEALQHPWMQATAAEELVRMDSRVSVGVANSLQDFAKASLFKRAALQMSAWSLTVQERAEVREAFIAIDKDGSGTVSLNELKVVLHEKLGQQFKDQDVEGIFDSMDSSGDELIHYTEFLAAACAQRIVQHEEVIHELFHKFDTDNSGTISCANLKEVLGDDFAGNSAEEVMADVGLKPEDEITYAQFKNFLTGHEGDAHTKVDNATQNLIDKHTHNKCGHGHAGAKRASAARGSSSCCSGCVIA